MKANEAPERLYLSKTIYSTYLYQVPDPDDETAVEYICADAFIEKAIKFINKANLYLYHCISEECDYVDTDKFTEDFRKYMKEE